MHPTRFIEVKMDSLNIYKAAHAFGGKNTLYELQPASYTLHGSQNGLFELLRH